MFMLKNKKVLVTGAKGMIGKHLVKLLEEYEVQVTQTDLPEDLRDRSVCERLCKGQDIIFHLAGIKGSPQRCMNAPASFSVPMLQFNANMIEAAYNAQVEWFLYTSSVGVYHPAELFKEDDVWTTFPSENDWYAGWAKRIGEMNIQAYMNEYSWNKCSIVRPANVYGPYDNFGQWSMVIPSLIKKAHEAGKNGKLSVWGDGSPIRDFVYAEDVARGMLFVVENQITEPVNLGSGTGVSIFEVANAVARKYQCQLEFDTSMPSGDKKRLMDMAKLFNYGFKLKFNLEQGIEQTINWYEDNIDVL